MVNIPFVKKKVKEAIYTAPITVTTFRRKRESDGRGGTIDLGEEQVGTFTALFDNTGVSNISLVTNESMRHREAPSPMLYVLYDDFSDFKHNDYFNHDNRQYRISFVANILDLDVLFMLSLEIVGDKDYGES